MNIQASNASIARITLQYFSESSVKERINDHYLENFEEEVDTLCGQSEEELQESAETFVEYYMYEVFEDCDEAFFIDGPIFEPDLVVHFPFVESLEEQRTGIARIRVRELIEAGATVIDLITRHSAQNPGPDERLLIVTEMAGNGELCAVPRYGDTNIFQKSDGKEFFLANAKEISILVKNYNTPYGVIKLFAGVSTGIAPDSTSAIQDLAHEIGDELDADDIWSSGLYSMDVNHQGVSIYDLNRLRSQVKDHNAQIFGLALGSFSEAEVDPVDLFKKTFQQ